MKTAKAGVATAKTTRTRAMQFKVQHLVTVTSGELDRLATTLAAFADIAKGLAVLDGSGGCHDGNVMYSLVTDGTYTVLVNAEGFDYPRYRGPRIANRLLADITAEQAVALCICKSYWPDGFTVNDKRMLTRVANKPNKFAL